MKDAERFLRATALCCLLFLCESLPAQSALDLRINAQIKDQPVIAVLEAIENRHPVRFFFKAGELPDRRLTTVFSDTRLEDALKELLRGTPVSFFVYRDASIVP